MSYGVQLVVWGDYACWTRPEMKAERVSYDVMTPSGARGILEAIYWKPQVRWMVDRIRVLKPIRFANIRRNEVEPHKVPQTKIHKSMRDATSRLSIHADENRQQRAALVLTDVCYGIEAHLELLDPRELDGTTNTEPVAKHLDILRRRLQRGACFHRPYLGCREFAAHFRPAEPEVFQTCPESLKGEKDLGFMLYDMVHDATKDPGWQHTCTEGCEAKFFRARMVDGVMDLSDCLAHTSREYGL